MLTLNTIHYSGMRYALELLQPVIAADLTRVFELKAAETQEVLAFLNMRPIHTVVMASFINDNGIEGSLNRGKFYGYRGTDGSLEGVALIGHSTLVEARTTEALKSLAFAAKCSKTRIHLIMSDGLIAESFWNYYREGNAKPRLVCTEALFELSFPFPVQKCRYDVRLARPEELDQIAEAQAGIAFMESGVDPMERDRQGFLERVMRRIEQGRIFVVVEDGRLVFKADVVALTSNAAYLEGVYVASERSGEGIGSNCLANVGLRLLNTVQNVCLLSNVDMHKAHRSFQKAGFRNTDKCTTVFV